MTVSVFVGTSVDGFIARRNGDLDFLPPGGGEPHGYDEFIAIVDALVIGRNTFETVLKFPTWPYGRKRVVVLSSRPVDLSVVRGGTVEQLAGDPAEIASKLAASGAHHFYVDGGITIQRFLSAGLVHALLSHECRCSLVTEFPSSARCRTISDSSTWRLGTTRAVWCKPSTTLPPNTTGMELRHCRRSGQLLDRAAPEFRPLTARSSPIVASPSPVHSP